MSTAPTLQPLPDVSFLGNGVSYGYDEGDMIAYAKRHAAALAQRVAELEREVERLRLAVASERVRCAFLANGVRRRISGTKRAMLTDLVMAIERGDAIDAARKGDQHG